MNKAKLVDAKLIKPKTSKFKSLKAEIPILKRKIDAKWQLRLYVIDNTLKSVAASANLKKFCEFYLKGRYKITIIDLLKKPQLAKGDQILAIPAVVRRMPKPSRTVMGNFTNFEELLVGLDLQILDA